MALFIKTFNRDGSFGLVNVAHIVSISAGSDGLVYTPSYGNVAGGYLPVIASCNQKLATEILGQLNVFIATCENGVFDAHNIVSLHMKEQITKMAK